jgi:HEAT repeat protein
VVVLPVMALQGCAGGNSRDRLPSQGKIAKKLVELQSWPDEETGRAAKDELASYGPAMVEPMLRLLQNPPDRLIRETAVRDACLAIGPEAVSPLVEHIRGQTGELGLSGQVALETLGYLGCASPEVLECLRECLRRETDPDAVFQATRAVARLGETAKPVLPDLLKVEEINSKIMDTVGRRAAWYYACYRVGHERDKMVARLKVCATPDSANSGEREEAILALTLIRGDDPEVVRILASNLTDRAGGVADAAREGLRDILKRFPSAVDILRRLADDPTTGDFLKGDIRDLLKPDDEPPE